MEALNAAESRNSAGVSHFPNLPAFTKGLHVSFDFQAATLQLRSDEQESSKQFIRRLFANVRFADDLPYEQWLASASTEIGRYVKQLESTGGRVLSFEREMERYKATIADLVVKSAGAIE